MSVSNQTTDAEPVWETSSAWLWLTAGIIFFGASFQIGTPLIQSKYDPGPSFTSMILGLVLLVGGAGVLVSRSITDEPSQIHQARQRPAKIIGIVVAYIVTIPILGFLVATLSFGIASMRLLSVGLKSSCFATAMLILVVHLVFVEMFGIQLPVMVQPETVLHFFNFDFHFSNLTHIGT